MGLFDWLFGGKKSASTETAGVNVEDFRYAFRHVGLESLFDKLKPIVRNGVDIVSNEVPDAKIGLGLSKWEGLPDLPKDVQWPTEPSGDPLLFIGQINLQEVAAQDVDGVLPKKGLLSFFLTQDVEFSGYNPDDRNQYRVLFTEDLTNLERKPLPESLPLESVPRRMAFKSNVSFPSPFSWQIADYDVAEDESDSYADLVDSTSMLGYPWVVQEPVEMSCELISNGHNLEVENIISYTDAADAYHFEHKTDWIPLLEFSLEDITGSVINDGSIFFMIRKQDLASQNFDKVICILQTT